MGKDAAPAPTPDPLIGQAAQNNVELGREALAFARQQYEEGKIRQVDLDAITKQVAQSALGSQVKAEDWAQQDRDVQAGLRDKYEGWADEDRTTQLANQTKYTDYADQDRATGQAANTKFGQLGQDAANLGTTYQGWLNDVANDFGKRADTQFAFAEQQQGRYGNTFQPIEDRMASDAMSWDSSARLASESGKAKADVLAGAQAQRDANQRSMMSMGVNPASGRFQGVERATDTLTALGSASAQNMARDNVRAQGIQLRGQAVGIGQQVLNNANTATNLGLSARGAQQGATQSAYATGAAGKDMQMRAMTAGLAATGVGNTTASLGLGASGSPYSSGSMAAGQQGGGYTGLSAAQQAGGSAIGATQAGTAGWAANNGIMSNGFGSAIGANQSGAGIANSLYGNQLNAWGQQTQANASSANGMMSAVGTIGGAALIAF